MFDVFSFKRNFCSNLSPAMLHLNFIIRRIHQLEQKLHCKYCLQKKLDLKFLVETFCKSWCMQVFLAENFEKETLLNFARKRCKGKRCANLVRFSRQKT